MLYIRVWDLMDCVFYLDCEGWSCRGSCMGNVSVSSCR